MRIKLKEITFNRTYRAILRRIRNISEISAWKRLEFLGSNAIRVEQFRNIHQGKRCFIIANGPSLGKMELDALKDEYTISMNRAYLMYEQWGFSPTYYACINELVLEQFSEDIGKLNMPRFLNFSKRSCFPESELDKNIIYLKLSLGIEDRFSNNMANAISSGGTVTFACLQLAYYMGFDEVVVIGMDHNFVEKGVPNTEEIRSSERDESHCHPEYFPKGVKWQLPDLHRSELAYSLAREAFEKDGRHIYDATIGGKCNIFTKRNFTTFFE
jgi:hypothetical protein